ncbi:MAG: ribosome-binding factor A [Patescibacteria group bacterium]
MRPFRNLKIASVIEYELGRILVRDFAVGGALVTITAVEVSTDLLQATVRLGIIPYVKGPEVFAAVSERRGEFQHQLLKKMNIRPMPQIRFLLDEPKIEETAT